MIRTLLLFTAMTVALGSANSSTPTSDNTHELHPRFSFKETCQKIAASISAASDVYNIGSFILISFHVGTGVQKH